jgi:hypothetical protein
LSLACGHLCHTPDAATPQSRILVTVTPAVDCALDETTLAPQAGVQLCQRPTDGVAFGLVVETVALVGILCTACAGVDAVLCLELAGEFVDVDRLHIASNSVLHLDTVARILEGNPLDTVLILTHDKWGCCRNRPRRSIGVDTRTRRRALVHVGCADWRCLRLLLRRAKS